MIDIKELLPQQPPFVMVDRLVKIDESSITTAFEIMPDRLFVEGDSLTEPGIIENMAQTGAARMGYINKYVHGSEVVLGFIGEVKGLVIERLPRVGDTLETTVEVKNEVLSTLLVRATAKIDGETIASCNMKISMTNISSGS